MFKQYFDLITYGAFIMAAALICNNSNAQEIISLDSLLEEMVDRDAVARYPQVDFRLKQDSSYNRESVNPEPPRNDPKGWFRNRDYNTQESDGNFIRV